MTVERAAGLVVYRKIADKIEYLLLKASYPPFHWSPPKGHVDPGEDEWTAALRETEEEAGLKQDQLIIHEDCQHTLAYQVPQRGNPSNMVDKTVKYWLAGLKNPDCIALSDEHTNSKWSDIEESVTTAGFKDTETLLRKFHEYLLNRK
ncbi:unnamed protein product [Auanema sp. JU1783]|nr:unnamed protein product [Auanema sp. JU1783]